MLHLYYRIFYIPSQNFPFLPPELGAQEVSTNGLAYGHILTLPSEPAQFHVSDAPILPRSAKPNCGAHSLTAGECPVTGLINSAGGEMDGASEWHVTIPARSSWANPGHSASVLLSSDLFDIWILSASSSTNYGGIAFIQPARSLRLYPLWELQLSWVSFIDKRTETPLWALLHLFLCLGWLVCPGSPFLHFSTLGNFNCALRPTLTSLADFQLFLSTSATIALWRKQDMLLYIVWDITW